MGVWKKQKTFRITRDLMRLLQKEHLLIFQSTLPDPRSRAQVTAIARFQSTLPAWGETTPVTTECPSAAVISIHSPRMGRDALADVVRSLRQTFQSTLPAWGETLKRERSGRATPISIHSPRMGRDPSGTPPVVGAWHFNPLSPHGERRSIRRSRTSSSPFQSTLPAWGETGNMGGRAVSSGFQSTLPAWGETVGRWWILSRYIVFQSTLPAWGETVTEAACAAIHGHFNPLSPHGERPLARFHFSPIIDFNPLSPRGERHSLSASGQTNPLFQSTLPAWGETFLSRGRRSGW